MSRALIDNLPLIAAAPDGIKALRGLILDLAVRGKLVRQDLQDEPASELLKRIAAERKHLIKAGNIRKVEVDIVGTGQEPHSIPDNWVWTRLGRIGDWGSGSTPPRRQHELYGGAVTWLKSGELNDNRNLLGSEETLTEQAVKTGSFRINQPGDVLIAMYGATIGKVAILAERAVTNQAVCGCTPFSGVLNEFLFFYLLSQRSNFHAASEGGAQPNISKVKIVWTPFPLPPLAEQRRIVAKVDELMALCDRLQAQQADAEAIHATLVKTLLDTLTQSQDADDFTANWHRLSQHFPTIFTTDASVDALKQSIVELAVSGRLVSQSPKDEPAAVLLHRIRTARAQLIDQKVIKTDKPLPALTKESLPFVSPSGWEWARLDEVVLISGGLTLGRAFTGRELVSRPYLRVANVQRGHLALSEVKEVLVPPAEVEKYRLLPKDLLITEGGDWDKVGRTAIWRGEIADCLHQNHIFKARPIIAEFNDRWVELYLNSGFARSYFAGASKQTTNLASINMTQLKACLLPMPPLSEQARIVAKVDEILVLCNTLKEQIADSRKVQRQLAVALVEQTLAA